MKPMDEDYRQIVRTAQVWRDLMQNGRPSDTEIAKFETWLNSDIRHQETYEQGEIYWAAFEHFRSEDVDEKYRRRSAGLWLEDAFAEIRALFRTTQFRLATAVLAIAAIAIPIALEQTREAEMAAPAPGAPILASYSTDIGEIATLA